MNNNQIIAIGKPNEHAYLHLTQLGTPLLSNNTLMLGDRLDTDVQFAIQHHFHSLLLFSGCTSSQDLESVSI